ncbi:MAG: hypothetical protein LBD24_04100 [Spirochaetaceae bacterium]|jgi:hypothetical protein|nr:hypothetical protein [Spirochaetaceae bacterium]
MHTKRPRPAALKRFSAPLLRAAVMAAVAGLLLAGCGAGILNDEKGYLFKFKVDNNTHLNGGAGVAITEVAFINGDTRNDNVLLWSSETLLPGDDRSRQYTVRGFTIEYPTSSTRIYGVRITFEDDTKAFNWSYAGHENKVLVSVGHPSRYNDSGIIFSPGNW